MAQGFEARLAQALMAWVDAVQRRPLRAVVGVLVLAGLGLAHAAANLGIQGETSVLFSDRLPFKQAEASYYGAFPNQYENMFVVVDGPTPEAAGAAAEALTRRLREATGTIEMAFLPGGGAFFEQHAFLYLETAELEDLADELAEAQPYLAELARDGSLHALASLLARGARALREGDVESERLVPILVRTREAIDAQLAGRDYALSWSEVLSDREIEGDPRSRVIFVQPRLSSAALQPAAPAIGEVRRAAEELGLGQDRDLRVRVTGDVALSYEEIGVVKRQAALSGIASFVCVGLILMLGLRSVHLVAATLLTLLAGLLLTAGFTSLSVGHLNMISAAFAVLFIGLGVDFGIHFCVRYRELRIDGHDHPEALRTTARDVGSSLVLCALTTSIGFLAFVPTSFIGVAELGIISSGGMLIGLFCTLTLLPALLSLPRPPSPRGVAGEMSWTGTLVELPVRYPRSVRGAAIVLGALAILALPEARFDNNPLNVRDPASESVKTLTELLERGGSSPWSVNAFAPDVASATILAERMRALPEVARVVTLTDFVPKDQSEKLEIIEEVALFLGPIVDASGTPLAVSDAKRVEVLEHLADELARTRAADKTPAFGEAAAVLEASLRRWLGELTASDAGVRLDALEDALLGTLPEQLRILNAALGAGTVTLENLPQALLDQMLGEERQVRVQIFPRDDLMDHESMAAFVDAVRSVDERVAGNAAEIVGSGRAVVSSLRRALILAVVLVATVVFLLWRRATETALVLIPLALATALTVAAAVLLGIPFNFADVIVLPLLLGIGIDSGIHLVHRARASGGVSINLLGTSTARAVGFSALTTIASFGTMGLASHRGLATLGQLLTLGVSMTLVCNLAVLPALITRRAPEDGTSEDS
jgi:hopanoid biosynthesis associated RND transporter like protein HpnN